MHCAALLLRWEQARCCLKGPARPRAAATPPLPRRCTCPPAGNSNIGDSNTAGSCIGNANTKPAFFGDFDEAWASPMPSSATAAKVAAQGMNTPQGLGVRRYPEEPGTTAYEYGPRRERPIAAR